MLTEVNFNSNLGYCMYVWVPIGVLSLQMYVSWDIIGQKLDINLTLAPRRKRQTIVPGQGELLYG